MYSNNDNSIIPKSTSPTTILKESNNSKPITVNNVFTESLASFVISKLKSHITKEEDNSLAAKSHNESNEINILKFFNGLQQKLQSTGNDEDDDELIEPSRKEIIKKKLMIKTSSANDLQHNSNNPIVLESSVYVDQSSLAFNGKRFIANSLSIKLVETKNK